MTYHNRHECKFVVPEAIAARMLQRATPFVELDVHAAQRSNHGYPVASLYLDDARGSLYQETIEGMASRYKLRVRSYTDEPAAPVFLEVKRRHDRVVQKLRCAVPRALLPGLLSGRVTEVPGLSPRERASLAEFLRLVQLRRAVPRCLVRYERQAFVDREQDDVRLTFDRRLSAMPHEDPTVRVHDARYATVPAGGVVLELKFTDRCPPWMLDSVRACELHRCSFSKYCRSVDALTSLGQVQGL
ncbi:MAG TPA: polyphosphate polymerase domain-containing protein [Planctomycetota bacterium]